MSGSPLLISASVAFLESSLDTPNYYFFSFGELGPFDSLSALVFFNNLFNGAGSWVKSS